MNNELCLIGSNVEIDKLDLQPGEIIKMYKEVIISILFIIFFGCSNPTEKFDGNYEPDVESTLKMNTNLTLKRIEENLQKFSVNRGVIQCGKDSIREWVISKSRIDGNKLRAHATMYIEREKVNARAIMWEDLNDPVNGNMFEEEISLEFARGKLIFCYWLPGLEVSKVCSIFFQGKHGPNS